MAMCPWGLPVLPGHSCLGPRARWVDQLSQATWARVKAGGFDQLSRATRFLIRGPADEQISPATRVYDRCPAGSTSCPGGIGPMPEGHRCRKALPGHSRLGPSA